MATENIVIKFSVDKTQLDGAVTSSKALENELKKAGVSAEYIDSAMEGVADALSEANVDAKTFNNELKKAGVSAEYIDSAMEGVADALSEANVDAKTFNKALADSANSTKSLKTQLADATNEAVRMSQQFGAFSKEAREAAKRAADIKDQIGDLNDTLDALNPEAKLNAFVKLGQGIQGGFQAATGALQVFGVENERITKLAQQFQGVLNLTEGINSVLQLKDVYGQLRLVLGVTTTAQAGLNTTIAAGAAAAAPFILALGAALGAVYLLTEGLQEEAEALKKANEERIKYLKGLDEAAKSYLDFIGVNEKIYEIMKLQGATEAQILQTRIKNIDTDLELLRIGRDKANDSKLKLEFDEKINELLLDRQINELKLNEILKDQKEVLKQMQPVALTSAKAIKDMGEEVLKLSSEGFQKFIDTFKILESSPYEVKKAVEDLKKSLESLQPVYNDLTDHTVKLARASKEIKPVGYDEDIKEIDDRKRAQQEYANIAVNAINVIAQYQRNATEKALQEEEEKRRAGLISEEEYQKEVSKIKRKQAIQDRNLAVFEVAINTASAIMKVASQTGTFAAPLIAAIAALGAAQIVAIQSAPLPKFKKGTLNVGGGNLDSDGGMQAIIHRGEAVIPADRNRDYHPTIAALFHRKINPSEINNFVQMKLNGKLPDVTARVNGRDIARHMPKNDKVAITNSSTLAKQIGREIASNINLRRQ